MRFYLDHNAHSPLRPAIREWLRHRLEQPTANAGSIHQEGQAARAEVDRARRSLHGALGVTHGRIVFTGSATEANNLAVQTLLATGSFAAAATEHASVLAPMHAADATGVAVSTLPVDGQGRIHLNELETLLRGGLRGVALMSMNNETGVMQPIAAAAALCLQYGAHLHVDAAQHLLRYPWNHLEGISSLTVSAHKAGGPLGVGALWWAPERSLRPLLFGGAQERGARPGTETGWLVGALGAQAALPLDATWASLAVVRDAFESRMTELLGAVVNGGGAARAPNTSNLWLPGQEAEELLMGLDLAGFAVSAGSACHAGAVEPSPVLQAMGLSEERVAGSLRFSFGPEHAGLDGAEIADRVAAALR